MLQISDDVAVDSLLVMADEVRRRGSDTKLYLMDAADIGVLVRSGARISSHCCGKNLCGGQTKSHSIQLILRGRLFVHASTKPIRVEIPSC